MPIRPGCPGSEENRTKDLHTRPLRQDPMAWQRESAYRHYSSRTILRGVIGTRCWLGPAEGARYGKESLGSSSYRLSNKANLDVVGDDRWGSQDRWALPTSRPHHLALHLPLDRNNHHFIGAMVLASAKMAIRGRGFPRSTVFDAFRLTPRARSFVAMFLCAPSRAHHHRRGPE